MKVKECAEILRKSQEFAKAGKMRRYTNAGK